MPTVCTYHNAITMRNPSAHLWTPLELRQLESRHRTHLVIGLLGFGRLDHRVRASPQNRPDVVRVVDVAARQELLQPVPRHFFFHATQPTSQNILNYTNSITRPSEVFAFTPTKRSMANIAQGSITAHLPRRARNPPSEAQTAARRDMAIKQPSRKTPLNPAERRNTRMDQPEPLPRQTRHTASWPATTPHVHLAPKYHTATTRHKKTHPLPSNTRLTYRIADSY